MSSIATDQSEERWYCNYYSCPICGAHWTDEWDSMCNDHCPNCDAEIEPYMSEDLFHLDQPLIPHVPDLALFKQQRGIE